MTKWALTQAGDIKPMSDEVKNRRQTKLEAAKKEKETRKKVLFFF